MAIPLSLGATDSRTDSPYPLTPEFFGAKGDGEADDSGAANLMLRQLSLAGGVARFAAGKTYLFRKQVELRIDRPVTAIVEGYGATLKTAGRISALKVSGNATPHGVAVCGLSVDHRDNGAAIAGFEGAGTTHLRLTDLSVEGNGNGEGYAAFWLHQLSASDPETGCFWTTMLNCAVRKRSGRDPGAIPIGLKLQGTANATTVINSAFGAVEDGCVILPEAPGSTLANSVVFISPWFEGVNNCIRVQAGAGRASVNGLRIAFARCEAVRSAVLSLTGTAVPGANPPSILEAFLAPNVSALLDNPRGLPVRVLGGASEHKEAGPTSDRPSTPAAGDAYFDTTIGRPIWCSQSGDRPIWVDANGAVT